MAEAAFSPNGNYYSAISQDGRLKIWCTETSVLKQEYTPDLHLTAPPSCLQWLSVIQSSQTPQKHAKRNSSLSENDTLCVALGTSNGKILIYSIVEAKVTTVLENEGKNIVALDWHKKYGLYSCDNDSTVCEWNLQTSSARQKYNIKVENKGKQANQVSAIKVVPHKLNTQSRYLVAASTQVRVWALHNGNATVIKTLGHNASSTALLVLATHKNVTWLIQGSQNERLLSFWDVTINEDTPQLNGDEPTPHKRKRSKSVTGQIVNTPTYNLVLEDAPRIVDVDLKEQDGSVKLSLAAATRSGVVHYYGHTLNGSSTKPLKPSVTLQVSTSEARPIPLVCCRAYTDQMLVGYTSGAVTLFEKVTPDLKTKTQVLIRGESKQNKKAQESEATDDHERSGVTFLEPLGGVSRKRATPGGQIEVPMEARLENLTLDVKGRSRHAVRENLTKLLVQGLHSRNRDLISTVLLTNDPKVAARSVASLPPDYVPLLMEQLADMAARKTSQCLSVCTWASAVLRCHSALLLATAAASPDHHLTRMMAVFTQRRSHLCQLLNLKGRLDLTIRQRSAPSDLVDQRPVLEYNDSSSDEMEVEAAASGSEEEPSWDEADSDSDDQ